MKSTNIDPKVIQSIKDAQLQLKEARINLKSLIEQALPKGTPLDVRRGKGVWEVELHSVGKDGEVNIKARTGNHFWFHIDDILETY